MKKWVISMVMILGTAGCLSLKSKESSKGSSIKRLDGSAIRTKEVDQTVLRLTRDAKVTGAAVAIFNDGKVVHLQGYGYRDKEKQLPLTPDSVMSGASLTKVAFAYMVMQLVQEDVVDLDKPVQLYLPKPLPEYAEYKDLADDERYKKITARMLLEHSSGFPNWREFEDDGKLKIHFEPGSRYAYSGEGMRLLQVAVEAVTGEPVEELMQKRVFQPLGMTRTNVVWISAFEDNYANGYDENENSLGPQRKKRASAAGSMLTTPADFSKFMQAVLQGKGLSKKSRDEMLSPQIEIHSKHQFPPFSPETTEENKPIRLSYGLGWGLYWTPYGKAFFKEGHDDGWRNYTVCFDDPKIGILIMTNSSNGESIYKELLETLQKNTYTPIEWERFTPYDQQH